VIVVGATGVTGVKTGVNEASGTGEASAGTGATAAEGAEGTAGAKAFTSPAGLANSGAADPTGAETGTALAAEDPGSEPAWGAIRLVAWGSMAGRGGIRGLFFSAKPEAGLNANKRKSTMVKAAYSSGAKPSSVRPCKHKL
jgi:hypothetical protein